MSHASLPSATWTYFENAWHEGHVGLFGPRTHALWLGSVVFDGARAFEGVTPDLDRHCTRIGESAERMGLRPVVPVKRWLELVADGLTRFPARAELYIRPLYWAEHGSPLSVPGDPDSTRWCLTLFEAPMPAPGETAITLSPYRKPTADSAPTDAKASCLYPNNGRAMVEAARRGFDNCVLCDAGGHVAELATSNLFMARHGIVYTPAANGSFLNGITRQRVIGLLRGAGVEVREATLSYGDLLAADELWSCGNYGKVLPITRIDERRLAPGPLYRRARELYWDFAHGR